MSNPEAVAIGPLKRADTEPAFDELWQAQVLAIADVLSRSGAFTTAAWSKTLGQELRRAEPTGAPDNVTTYYEAALRTLESLLVGSGIVTPEVIADRRDAWMRAYLTTPHGQPVNLGNT